MRTHPVLYVAAFESVAASGGSSTTQVNFNDSGVIRGLTYEAIDNTGVVMSDAATLNVYRQNRPRACNNLARG